MSQNLIGVSLVVISLRCNFTGLTDAFGLLGVPLVWDGWTGLLLQMTGARGISAAHGTVFVGEQAEASVFGSGGAKLFLRRGCVGARWAKN